MSENDVFNVQSNNKGGQIFLAFFMGLLIPDKYSKESNKKTHKEALKKHFGLRRHFGVALKKKHLGLAAPGLNKKKGKRWR